MSTLNLSYPRPDFERSRHWQSLDGTWEFARGPARAEESAYLAPGSSFPEEIVVPFPWESQASGLEAAWLERGWYRRTVEVPYGWDGLDVVLHFGGAHHTCRVFLDGRLVTGHAGAGPFECDLTPALSGRRGVVVVAVDAPIDKRAIGHGKQRSVPADDYDSCAFQPSSGIWQPVWLEARPATFLRSLRADSAPALDAFILRTEVAGPARDGASVRLRARHSGEELELVCGGDGRAEGRFDFYQPRKWSPEDPHLPERQGVVGQMAALVRALDPSRPVVDNSGWSHVSTDLVDWHYYEPDLATWAKNVRALVHDEQAEIPVPLHPPALEMKPLAVDPAAIRGRPNLSSEYGAGLTSVERAWHLKWQTQEMRRHDRLSGYVYTELYDVEHELAGLYRYDRDGKDLANMEPSQVNAETVTSLIPVQPGIDVVTTGPVRFEVRLSHHGHRAAHGRFLARWGRHLGVDALGPAVHEGNSSPPITAEPFVLGAPVVVEALLPLGWNAGRLHIWVESGGASIASTSIDVVLSQQGAR